MSELNPLLEVFAALSGIMVTGSEIEDRTWKVAFELEIPPPLFFFSRRLSDTVTISALALVATKYPQLELSLCGHNGSLTGQDILPETVAEKLLEVTGLNETYLMEIRLAAKRGEEGGAAVA